MTGSGKLHLLNIGSNICPRCLTQLLNNYGIRGIGHMITWQYFESSKWRGCFL